MFGLLESYIFTGMAGNAAYEIAKSFWKKTVGKDLNELFLDTFDQSVNSERERLSKFGDHIQVDRVTLLHIVESKLSNSEHAKIAQLNEDEFTHYLAKVLRENSVLVLGNHNLDPESYDQILRNLLRQTKANFRRKVVENQAIFNDILLTEVENDRAELLSITDFLEERFGLVLSRLNDLKERPQLTSEHYQEGCSMSAQMAETSVDSTFGQAVKQPGPGELESSGKFSETEIRQILVERMDLEELRTLCQDLHVDYDSLRGEGKTGKARELVSHMKRHGQLAELAAWVKALQARLPRRKRAQK